MGDEQNDEIVEAVVRFIREETARLVETHTNWKITLNGSGCTVRGVVEAYHTVIRADRSVSQSEN